MTQRISQDEVRGLARMCGLKVHVKRMPQYRNELWYDFYVGDGETWKNGGADWIGAQSFAGTRGAYTFLTGFYAGMHSHTPKGTK